MAISNDSIKCADCGASIDAAHDNSEIRALCTKCGSNKRIYNDSIELDIVRRIGLEAKVKRPDERKPYVEDSSAPDYSKSRSKFVHKQRIIDRDNDFYSEEITDYETGEIIHYCKEPLSKHQGHGSAKTKK